MRQIAKVPGPDDSITGVAGPKPGGVGGTPAWSPGTLTDIYAWYDAADAGSFSFSSGTTVSEWRDKSGNGRHLNIGSAERDGSKNSLPTVTFNGTSDHLIADVGSSLAKPHTILVVANCSVTTAVQRTLCGFVDGSAPAVADGRIYRTSANVVAMFQGANVVNDSWGTAYHSVVGVFNGASSSLQVDNDTPVGGNAGALVAADLFRVGHYGSDGTLAPTTPFEYWIGNVCEIVVMGAAIATEERSSWDEYVTDKWAV